MRKNRQTTEYVIPSPHLEDAINSRIIASEIEGGVWLENLAVGSTVEIETENRIYSLVNLGDGRGLIAGHPRFCPEPVLVEIRGSNWSGSMLKMRFIGRGMHLEFVHPEFRSPIITSEIREIREVGREPA